MHQNPSNTMIDAIIMVKSICTDQAKLVSSKKTQTGFLAFGIVSWTCEEARLTYLSWSCVQLSGLASELSCGVVSAVTITHTVRRR